MVDTLSPHSLESFWATICSAAYETRQKRVSESVTCAFGIGGFSLAVGTMIAPGIGTLIGGCVGFLCALLVIAAIMDLTKNLVFSQVLEMKHQTGCCDLQYANLLYCYYGGPISYQRLVDNIMPQMWNSHLDQIKS